MQDHTQNLEEKLWIGGRREVSIISHRPLTRSNLKQERSFFRGTVSTFLQLVVAEVSNDKAKMRKWKGTWGQRGHLWLFTPGTCFLLTILVDPWVGKLYSKPFLFATIYPMLELPVPISDLGSVYMRMEFHCNKLRVQQSGKGVLPIMTYTGRLRRNGVPVSGFRYKKGYGFHLLKYMKG